MEREQYEQRLRQMTVAQLKEELKVVGGHSSVNKKERLIEACLWSKFDFFSQHKAVRGDK